MRITGRDAQHQVPVNESGRQLVPDSLGQSVTISSRPPTGSSGKISASRCRALRSMAAFPPGSRSWLASVSGIRSMPPRPARCCAVRRRAPCGTSDIACPAHGPGWPTIPSTSCIPARRTRCLRGKRRKTGSRSRAASRHCRPAWHCHLACHCHSARRCHPAGHGHHAWNRRADRKTPAGSLPAAAASWQSGHAASPAGPRPRPQPCGRSRTARRRPPRRSCRECRRFAGRPGRRPAHGTTRTRPPRPGVPQASSNRAPGGGASRTHRRDSKSADWPIRRHARKLATGRRWPRGNCRNSAPFGVRHWVDPGVIRRIGLDRPLKADLQRRAGILGRADVITGPRRSDHRVPCVRWWQNRTVPGHRKARRSARLASAPRDPAPDPRHRPRGPKSVPRPVRPPGDPRRP